MGQIIDGRSLGIAGLSRADGIGYPTRGPLIWHEDFLDVGQLSFSATANLGKYLVTGVNGVAANFTVATGEEFGAIVNTTTGASADSSNAQLCGTSFLCQAASAGVNGRARNMRFWCRMKTATITANTIVMGMHITGSADFTTTQANGFEFVIVNGVVGFRVKNAGGTTATTATGHGTIAVNVYHTYEIRMGSGNELNFYVDGVKATAAAAIDVTANVPTGLALSPGFGTLTSSAATKACTIDFIGASVEEIVGGRL